MPTPEARTATVAEQVSSEEDRILRVWTPVLLRTILLTAAGILAFGLILMATTAPGYYVEHYRAVAAGHVHRKEPFAQIAHGALTGDPHSVLTVGLFVLTLVPLGRVAFCFLLFVKKNDYTYVFLTGYVLFGLALGMFLGRIG